MILKTIHKYIIHPKESNSLRASSNAWDPAVRITPNALKSDVDGWHDALYRVGVGVARGSAQGNQHIQIQIFEERYVSQLHRGVCESMVRSTVGIEHQDWFDG